MRAGVKSKGKAGTSVAVESGASKAVGFRERDLPLGENPPCRVKVYTAQDAAGQWYGSFTLNWGPAVSLKNHMSSMCPSIAPKFATEGLALVNLQDQIDDWIETCRLGALDVADSSRARSALQLLSDINLSGLPAAYDVPDDGQPVESAPVATAASAPPRSLAQLRDVFAKTPTVEIPLKQIFRRETNRGGKPVSADDVRDLMATMKNPKIGLLNPIIVRQAKDGSIPRPIPLYCYELIAGERRTTAARELGWQTITARVVKCSEAEALLACNVDNVQQGLTPMAKAKAIREAIDHGADEATAGQSVGAPSGVKNLLRLLELPEKLQAAVDAGRLSQKAALACVPWVGVPTLEQAVLEMSDGWNPEGHPHTVECLLQQDLRPVEPGDRRYVSYPFTLCGRDGNASCGFSDEIFAGGKKKLTPTAEAVAKYGLIQVKIANKPTWLATNTAAWDAREQEFHSEKPAGSKKSPGSPPAKVSAAEQRRKDEESDRLLHERITRPGGLAEIALRLAIARSLQPSNWLTEWAYDLLISTARDSEGSTYLNIAAWQHEGDRLVLQERHPEGAIPTIHGGDGYRSRLDYGRYQVKVLNRDGDPVTDTETKHWHVTRLLLWPQQLRDSLRSELLAQPGIMPARFPAIDQELIGRLADLSGARIMDVWESAAEEYAVQESQVWTRCGDYLGVPAVWFAEYLGAYATRRQFEALDAELGFSAELGFGGGLKGTLGELRTAMAAAHAEKRLKLPKALTDWEKSVRPAKHK